MPSLSLSVLAREESQLVTTSASGPTTVLLVNAYFAAKDVRVSPTGNGTAAYSGIADQIALYPVAGESIYLEATHASSGNDYTLEKIDSPAYVIQAGDHLWWDQYAIDFADDGGMAIRFSDTTTTIGSNDTDGNAAHVGKPASVGQWVTRKLSLATWVGKTISEVLVILESNGTGRRRALFRAINVKDGSGGGASVTQAVWNAGVVANRTVFASAGSSNVICNRTNSFDAYVLNNANTKVAVAAFASFKGI
jgi:hypothetical protein